MTCGIPHFYCFVITQLAVQIYYCAHLNLNNHTPPQMNLYDGAKKYLH